MKQMRILTIYVKIRIPAQSLKEKRRVIKSIMQKCHNKFNVSIAEIGLQEQWQWAEFGISSVSNSKTHLERTASQILNWLELDYRIQVVLQETEIW